MKFLFMIVVVVAALIPGIFSGPHRYPKVGDPCETEGHKYRTEPDRVCACIQGVIDGDFCSINI